MTNPADGDGQPGSPEPPELPGPPEPRARKPRRLGFVLTVVGLLSVAALYLAIAVSALLR